jgi:hypothetical protein
MKRYIPERPIRKPTYGRRRRPRPRPRYTIQPVVTRPPGFSERSGQARQLGGARGQRRTPVKGTSPNTGEKLQLRGRRFKQRTGSNPFIKARRQRTRLRRQMK